jgi:hypothetical protein
MLALATTLDGYNNLGCPLGNTQTAWALPLLPMLALLGIGGGRHLKKKQK